MGDEQIDQDVRLVEVAFDFDDLGGILRAAQSDDGRTLTGYMVPWDRETRVSRPIAGWEVFRRGALSKTIGEQLDAGKVIPLFGEHSDELPLAKLVESHDDDLGQFGVWRMFSTGAARDARELINEGLWRGLSVAGMGVKARTKVGRHADGSRLVERGELVLDHVGLVRKPAYVDAQVLALRSDDGGGFDAAAAIAERQARRAHLVG